MRKKTEARLREISPAARGRQDTGSRNLPSVCTYVYVGWGLHRTHQVHASSHSHTFQLMFVSHVLSGPLNFTCHTHPIHTEMQKNMWARLRESRMLHGAIHAP